MKYLFMVAILSIISLNVFSGDLDDGIKKTSGIAATNKELQMKENYSYLNANINAKIARGKAGDKSIKLVDDCGTGNVNIIGAKNSRITTVINNSNNTGATSKCGN